MAGWRVAIHRLRIIVYGSAFTDQCLRIVDCCVHSGMARMYCSQHKFDDAAKEMKLALAGAPDNQKVYVAGLVKKLEAQQDIN